MEILLMANVPNILLCPVKFNLSFNLDVPQWDEGGGWEWKQMYVLHEISTNIHHCAALSKFLNLCTLVLLSVKMETQSMILLEICEHKLRSYFKVV